MRKASVAEWVLSLVTEPARAASAVGDLIEEAPSHGPGWFWATVSWTTLSLLARDLKSQPRRLVRLAALGVLMEGVSIVVPALAGIVVAILAELISPGRFSVWVSSPHTAVYAVWGYGITLPIQFQIGRWLARSSPGHELTPCAVMMLLWVVVELVADRLTGISPAQQALNLAVYQVLASVAFCGGAIQVRRRRQKA
jgi:hypothetical protein